MQDCQPQDRVLCSEAVQPRHRLLLTSLVAAIAAVIAGWKIAESDFFLLALATVVIGTLVVEWTGRLRPEAALCGFLVAGYVLGNRGFAQIMPLGRLPLPIGECGLALAFALTVVRGALARRVPFRHDAINLVLLLWLALGIGRLLWDFRVYRFDALRDFAAVYYCSFFFIAQAFAQNSAEARRFHFLLVGIFAALPPLAFLVESFPVLFLTKVTLNGVPIFYFKGDLLATFLCGGFFLLLPSPAAHTSWITWLRRGLAVASLGFGLYLLSRAAMVGVGVSLFGCLLARRWYFLRAAGLTILLGLLVALSEAAFAHGDFRQSKLYAAYEHFTSILDVGGTRSYVNAESADSGANNQFRTIWWRSIIRETIVSDPAFGLGFGYDLAEGFIRDFDPAIGDEFTARSPHSMVMTIFGRMGFVGLFVWLAFMLILARESLHLARRARRQPGENLDELLALHSLCWVILISACFGVVLEGPMGAVVFWTILGLAHSQTAEDPAATAPLQAARETASA